MPEGGPPGFAGGGEGEDAPWRPNRLGGPPWGKEGSCVGGGDFEGPLGKVCESVEYARTETRFDLRGLNVGSGALRDALKDEGSNVGGAAKLLLSFSLSSCSSWMTFCGGGASILMFSCRWLVNGEK